MHDQQGDDSIKNKIPGSRSADKNARTVEGVVSGHRDGHGFLVPDDGSPDIYIAPNEMRDILHRDRVRVRVIRLDRKGRPEGQVIELLERSAQPIIGRLLHEGGQWLLVPEDKRYGQDVRIAPKATAGASVGQIVVVELTGTPALRVQPTGRVIEVLGNADDAGMEIEIAVRKYAVPHVFSEACVQQARALPETVQPQDRAGRVDLTDVALLTIDGEDARDFDDAVYCEPAAQEGHWRLLVAIADVSHYVQTGSAIDKDAFERATSVYFPRRVIPMLPEKLSNGLCSLNPDVQRLCVVCDMLVDDAGRISAYQFYRALMRSHARLTYTQVAAALAEPKGAQARALKALMPHLRHLHALWQALCKARQRRGALDLDMVETAIVCDDDGRVLRIEPRERNDAHRIIEEAMLAANECAADFVQSHRHPLLYRTHEAPGAEKTQVLRQYLQALGVPCKLSEPPAPREFAAIAQATHERPDAQHIHMMLLRSMQQAVYTPLNQGHFGLAYDTYTHFTSPIRRYPDLLTHRVIKAILQGQSYTLPALPLPDKHAAATPSAARAPGKARTALAPQAWQAAGLHCSACERRADEASRDVQAWLKCAYMSAHLGESFAGHVSAVTSFGLFITLQSVYVEGLVHISELGADYYQFDETRQELRGERKGERFGLGTPVRVQVARVDLDARKIDLRLLREDAAAPQP